MSALAPPPFLEVAAATADTSFIIIIVIFLEKKGRKEVGRKRGAHATIFVSFLNPVLVQEFNYTYFPHFLYSDILIKDALIQFRPTVGIACKNILPFLYK